MIRYDVLWHDLVKDLYERCMNYESAAMELEKMHAEEMAHANRHASHALYDIMSRANAEYKNMKERDEEVEGSAVTLLQEVLQELKKMNKREEVTINDRTKEQTFQHEGD